MKRRYLGFAILAWLALCGAALAGTPNHIFPVHGRALTVPAAGTVIAAIDGIPGTYSAQTHRYTTDAALRSGETFDAYLDARSDRLSDVHQATAFVPGLPNGIPTHVSKTGDMLPDYQFETQDGRLVHLADFRGKVVLLSFIYTRCPDRNICPAISGKFAYVQHQLDPAKFQLVTITLDPLHDSPAILKRYGALFGADSARWSLLTGEPAEIKAMLDTFSLDSLETHPGLFLHGDTLAILNAKGEIATLIPTAGWAPDDVIAAARNIAGERSNWLRRFELATIAGVLAFCGGSLTTGAVVLDSVVVLAGFAILGWILYWVTKNIIVKERF